MTFLSLDSIKLAVCVLQGPFTVFSTFLRINYHGPIPELLILCKDYRTLNVLLVLCEVLLYCPLQLESFSFWQVLHMAQDPS